VFLVLLNSGDKKICSHPCFFFIINSGMLCAEPIILNFFLSIKKFFLIILLNEGKYNPSNSCLIANLRLFER